MTHNNRESNVPSGPIDLTIAGDYFQIQSEIQYVPNGKDQGILTIGYRFH